MWAMMQQTIEQLYTVTIISGDILEFFWVTRVVFLKRV